MKQIAVIAMNCARQLAKAQRSASQVTRTQTHNLWSKTYRQILTITRLHRQPDNSGDVLKQIAAQLRTIHDTLVEAGSAGCSPTQLDQLDKLIEEAYPPPIVEREKAKPTIRLAVKK